MTSTAGIKFKTSSRIYTFSAGELQLKPGDEVVVESELGMSIGRVVTTGGEPPSGDKEIKPILRAVTEEDIQKEKENESLKSEARAFCNERISARGLPMKLVDTEIALDRKRYIFYFTADTRIDFRELVKDLASKFRTRIELRQIGVRDAAMITGGLGVCGREFCCRSFLRGFAPISIKMAKQQELVLNAAKLSGACGRLLCCLNYEYDDIKKNTAGEQEEDSAKAEPIAEKLEIIPSQPAHLPAQISVTTDALQTQPAVKAEAVSVDNAPAQTPQTQEGEQKHKWPKRKKKKWFKKPKGPKPASDAQGTSQHINKPKPEGQPNK